MDGEAAFRHALQALAERSFHIRLMCGNEESTKLYLVMPALGCLGYDHTNPAEVQPEYAADFRDGQPNRADFVVLKDGVPIIAVECKPVGTELSSERGQLRSYFNALLPVKLGILTNGIEFEFFVDSEEPNVMDAEPFAILDLEAVARSGVSDDLSEALWALTKPNFDPEIVAELAQMQLVRKRLRAAWIEEVRAPSDDVCRLLLQKVGLRNLRKASIGRMYGSVVKTSLEEALILPVVERLRTDRAISVAGEDDRSQVGQRITTTERELAIFSYVRRRLSYLVSDERHFRAIEDVQYRDFVGKMVVFYGRERKGRLFDYIEGLDGYDKFVFPQPVGEIVTNDLADIDVPLRTIFEMRVRELSEPAGAKLARAVAIGA